MFNHRMRRIYDGWKVPAFWDKIWGNYLYKISLVIHLKYIWKYHVFPIVMSSSFGATLPKFLCDQPTSHPQTFSTRARASAVYAAVGWPAQHSRAVGWQGIKERSCRCQGKPRFFAAGKWGVLLEKVGCLVVKLVYGSWYLCSCIWKKKGFTYYLQIMNFGWFGGYPIFKKTPICVVNPITYHSINLPWPGHEKSIPLIEEYSMT